MNIEKASNGYVVREPGFSSTTSVYKTLDELCAALLFKFEGRSESFGGGSYGKIEIIRGKEQQP